MQKVADLHVHTYFSDGTFSPEDAVKHSKERGLSAIAITDHDSCSGIERAIATAKDLGIEVISGVEMSAEFNGVEAHILGYFVDWKDLTFIKKLEEISAVRRNRAKKILEKLREHGMDVSEKEFFEFSGFGSVGRLHIAQFLAKKGHVGSIEEAFRKYLGDNGSCYVKKFKLSPKEAVSMIKRVGGVAVLAHPKTIRMDVDKALKMLIEDGIQGIEAYYYNHTSSDENKFKELAEKYSLLISGGSDCHGLGKKEVLLGSVKIPYELVDKIKEASK